MADILSPPASAVVHSGDFRERGGIVADGSVHLMLTSAPPSDPELYAGMARFAARKLAPRGAFVIIAEPEDAGLDELVASRLTDDLTPDGGLVCDPCCGAGSVLIGAARVGRRAVGFEADPDVADRAGARIQSLYRELADIPQIGGVR